MLDRFRVDPQFRRTVLWAAAAVVGLFVFVLIANVMNGSAAPEPSPSGSAAAPSPAPEVSPSPSSNPTERAEPPRPTKEQYAAAADAAIGYLTAVNTWSYPIDYQGWQAEVAKYTSATSPYPDLLEPVMSLQMMKQCVRVKCAQTATVKQVGDMQYLGDTGFRGRFTVQVQQNYVKGADTSPVTWEMEMFGTPPSVTSAIPVGTSGGADGR